jgi:polysaccharide deacetylase 2 family uncharacterized protein YibQ
MPILGLAAFFLWQWWNGGETPRETYEEAKALVVPQTATTGAAIRPAAPQHVEAALPRVQARKPRDRKPAAATPGNGGDIVLIIDDLGFDGQPLERLMALDPNVNAAILPNGTRATEFAEKLNARGFEILVHLPMQPRGAEAPGRNAILTSMSDEEIARATRENILAIPHARGVNNHMGSLATSDRRVMENVLRAIPDGMYFIDSRTSGR